MEQVGVYGFKSPFWVRSSVYNCTHLRPLKCACTHHTRFQSHVECAIGKVFTTNSMCSRCNGLHLCMGGRVVERFGKVVRPGNNPVLTYNNGAHRHFAFGCCLFGFFECLCHKFCKRMVLCCHEQDKDSDLFFGKNDRQESDACKIDSHPLLALLLLYVWSNNSPHGG